MITFKLNNQQLQIPTSWEEVTFAQYLQIFDLKDDVVKLVSLFTNQDYEQLKKATIVGLDRLLEAISFINTPHEIPTYSPTCGPYTLPANSKGQFNIQYESLGQFEDARQAMNKVAGKSMQEHTKAYGKYVAIYLQKIRDGEYDFNKVESMEAEVQNFPALQVCSLGQFFFVKLKTLLNGTRKTSPPTPQSRKKSKRVLKPSKRSSGHTRK
jgi:hypothetical protein